MRVRCDVRRHRYQPGRGGRLVRPVIDEDVRLVLGRQVDRAPPPVGTPVQAEETANYALGIPGQL